MVKENTHLFGAYRIFERLDENLKKIINENIDYYYIGSIAPDIFFFSDKTHFVSDKLHGKNGELTNEIIFKLLKNKDKRNLAFLFGYLTHCAFDIKFHPVIYYYTGNYYDKNKEKRERATYLHRHFETYIDNKLKHRFLIYKIIKKNLIRNLLFFKIIVKDYKITMEEIKKTLNNELFLNRIFKSSIGYYIYFLITKLGISNKKNLGLFYKDLRRDKIIFEQDLRYRDIIDGKKIKKNFDELFEEALEYGKEMINTTYKFSNNKISKDQCVKIIDGKSLDTGKLRTGVSKIKYAL
ncbi:MAG: zinc dependent phospholipase C family protein [archaeon]